MSRIFDLEKTQAIPRIVEIDPIGLVTGEASLFEVIGKIIINQLIGEITIAIAEESAAIKLIASPAVGNDIDLCASSDMQGFPVGSILNISGVVQDELTMSADAGNIAATSAIIVNSCILKMDSRATIAGAVKWTLHYTPVDLESIVIPYVA